jgi:hypothetical protein
MALKHLGHWQQRNQGRSAGALAMKFIASTALVLVVCGSNVGALFAADVTLVSGFYQKENEKIDGKTKGSISTVSLGGRFSDDLNTDTAWIGQGNLNLRSYTASGGTPTPDNSVGMTVGGGARFYFKPIATAVVPYVDGIATLRSDKSARWNDLGYTQVTKSGLYYGANAGIRAGLGENFFVELELPFFESPLFAVTKTETVEQVGDAKTTSTEENTETALYVRSSANLMDARLGVGMRL